MTGSALARPSSCRCRGRRATGRVGRRRSVADEAIEQVERLPRRRRVVAGDVSPLRRLDRARDPLGAAVSVVMPGAQRHRPLDGWREPAADLVDHLVGHEPVLTLRRERMRPLTTSRRGSAPGRDVTGPPFRCRCRPIAPSPPRPERVSKDRPRHRLGSSKRTEARRRRRCP